MDKLISPKMKKLLIVIAVIYVAFTVVWIIQYTKWKELRSFKSLSDLVAREETVFLNQEDIEVSDGVVSNGTKITDRVIEKLKTVKDLTAVKVRGESSPIGINATAIYQILNFLVLLLVMIAVGWRPIIDMLDARAAKIKDDLDSAQNNRTEAAALKTEYEGMLDDGRQQRSELIAKGEKMGQDERQRLLNRTQEEIGRLRQKADEELVAMEGQLREKLRSELTGLTTRLAGQVLRREVKPEDHQRLVDDFVAELQKSEKS